MDPKPLLEPWLLVVFLRIREDSNAGCLALCISRQGSVVWSSRASIRDQPCQHQHPSWESHQDLLASGHQLIWVGYVWPMRPCACPANPPTCQPVRPARKQSNPCPSSKVLPKYGSQPLSLPTGSSRMMIYSHCTYCQYCLCTTILDLTSSQST